MSLPAGLDKPVGYETSHPSNASWWWTIVDELETTPEVMWPNSVRVYEQMRRQEPQLRAVLNAVGLPIRKAGWVIDPAAASDKVTRLVAEDLGLPILGETVPAAPSRRLRGRLQWREHVRLALLMLVFGHSPFEQLYAIENQQARLRKLSVRLPSTISRFEVATDGGLDAIWQSAMPQPGGGSKGVRIEISRLVMYVNEREGGNWVGQSLLRAAYGPWLVKQRLMRVGAQNHERWGVARPKVQTPPGASAGQVATAARMASEMRGGDSAGAGLPAGWTESVEGIRGTVPDPIPFMRYLDELMAKQVMAQFLDLGSTPNGSRALGESFIDFFTLAIQAVAEEIADTATTHVVEDLVDLNFGEDEPAPRVVVPEAGRSEESLASSIASLIQAGALTLDDELEGFLRDALSLPAKATTVTPPTPLPVPKPVAASRRPAAAVTLRRQPTAVEAAAGTDFTTVQSEWLDAVDQVVAAMGPVRAAQIADLVKQVDALVAAGDIAGLANLTPSTSDGAELIAAALLDMAAAGAADAATEAGKQGVAVTPPGTDALPAAYLTAAAALAAALLARDLGSSAARTAMAVTGPDADAGTVSAAVQDALDALTDRNVIDIAGNALSAAQNQGRAATFAAAPHATYYASEILDANTCAACANVDGREFASLDEASAAYASGGYVDCEGGLRCRGVIVAVYDDAQQVAAQA